MVWEKSDSCSSIAMLQERFRQLEKVKEMREEKELLKLISSLSSSSSSSSNNHQQSYPPAPVTCNNSNFVYVSEMDWDSHELLSLSLWPSSSSSSSKMKDKYWDSYWDINNLISGKPCWLNDVPPLAARPSLIKKIDDDETTTTTSSKIDVVVGSEVDTTLHL